MRARDILGPSGPLARNLPHYETREAQLQMADAVERALAEDRRLVCEAGTGTGKTLAYLVPAILSGRKVVISTATKALQEQIFLHDLPLLARYADLHAHAVLVKGLSNYLCLRRYHAFRTSPEALRPRYADALATMERWEHETDTGDLSELASLAESDPIWAEVASSSETRVGFGCPHFSSCFVTKLKREAETAQILVVNHALLFADLALKGPHQGGALPIYDAVIFDEAHQLEDIATDFFGLRVSNVRIEVFLRDTERALSAAGLSTALLTRSAGGTLAARARDTAAQFFAMLSTLAPPDGGRQPLETPIEWSKDLVETYHKLDAALEAVGKYAEAKQSSEALELAARRAEQLRADLAEIVGRSFKQVTWLEVGARSISLGRSPVEVSELLRQKLFDIVPAAVLTSATLATNGGFSFFRNRIGLREDESPVDELVLSSPFDFPQNALLYLPRDLPDTQSANFAEAAAERIDTLLRASRGGSFVLCTSTRSMRLLHTLLRKRGGLHGPLLLQGDAPKSALLATFRAAHNAVLIATMSFWEGVDVPGSALRLVILDKIPFPVPTDPVVAARSTVLEEAGENPFLGYAVPAAAIALKQGFGRLIRTATDRGVVALLDKRIVTRGYGKHLLRTLPPARQTELLNEVEAFLGDIR